MSRRSIEQRKCDRCGESENFDDTSRAAAREKLWSTLATSRNPELRLDLCNTCTVSLDEFMKGPNHA